MDNLFGSQTLDVAIGVVLFFLLVSLLCTAAQEALEVVLKARALNLEKGLREILADPDGSGITKVLFDHPMIFGLFNGAYDPDRRVTLAIGSLKLRLPRLTGGNLPSYIPAGHFASALLDIVARGPASPYPLAPATATAGAPITIDSLRAAAAAFPNPRVSRAILVAIDEAEGDLAKVKANLETWFNGTMDRVSGWYKRRTQMFLFFIGLAAAVALNLDAITVIQHLANDKTLREAAVSVAAKTVEQGPPPTDSNQGADPKALERINQMRANLDAVGYPTGWVDGRPAPQALTCQVAAPEKLVSKNGQGVPDPGKTLPSAFDCNGIVTKGWLHYWAGSRPAQAYVLTPVKAASMTLGWIITALAVMLGAPFWFDLLSKFMTIRSTIKPKAKVEAQTSPDSQAATTPNAAPQPDAGPAPPEPPPPAAQAPPDPPFTPNQWADRPDPDEGIL